MTPCHCYLYVQKFLRSSYSIVLLVSWYSLLNSCQSGFRPNVSCINELISITHNIYPAFDANASLDVRRVFLNLSKAFDKVWHEDLLYKLNNNGINGNAFQLKSHSSTIDVEGNENKAFRWYWKDGFLGPSNYAPGFITFICSIDLLEASYVSSICKISFFTNLV